MSIFIFKIFIFFIIYYASPCCEKLFIYLMHFFGPFFIKLCQFISTREDIATNSRISILLKMQDSLPIEKIKLHKILSNNLLLRIKYIEPQPLSSASIAQVYKAQLDNSEYVAIKIIKPKQLTKIHKDLARFMKLMHILSRIRILERFNLYKIAMQIQANLLLEFDLNNEANNIEEFRCHFSDNPNVNAPFVYKSLSTVNVLVMEWIDGVNLKHFSASQDILDKITKAILISHIDQVYKYNKFHADIHHSNILITKDYKIFFIDFGSYCKISSKDANTILRIINAFLHQDYYRIALIHKEAKYIPDNSDIFKFANECKKIGLSYLAQTNPSFGNIFKSLLKIAQEFGMELQPQLIMLQKTMVMTEGVVRHINQEMDIWKAIKVPIKRRYIIMITIDLGTKIFAKLTYYKNNCSKY